MHWKDLKLLILWRHPVTDTITAAIGDQQHFVAFFLFLGKTKQQQQNTSYLTASSRSPSLSAETGNFPQLKLWKLLLSKCHIRG